jgi:hypothetical protein
VIPEEQSWPPAVNQSTFMEAGNRKENKSSQNASKLPKRDASNSIQQEQERIDEAVTPATVETAATMGN